MLGSLGLWESPKLNYAVSHPCTMCGEGCSVSCLTHYPHHYHWLHLIFQGEAFSVGTLCRDIVSVLSYQDWSNHIIIDILIHITMFASVFLPIDTSKNICIFIHDSTLTIFNIAWTQSIINIISIYDCINYWLIG